METENNQTQEKDFLQSYGEGCGILGTPKIDNTSYCQECGVGMVDGECINLECKNYVEVAEEEEEEKISQLNLGYDPIEKNWFDRYGNIYQDDEVENGHIKPGQEEEEEVDHETPSKEVEKEIRKTGGDPNYKEEETLPTKSVMLAEIGDAMKLDQDFFFILWSAEEVYRRQMNILKEQTKEQLKQNYYAARKINTGEEQ